MIRSRHFAFVAAFAALSLALPPSAQAAPCAGFTDVDDADTTTGPFCESVQWIRNRNVTSGVTATQYAPFLTVNRLQMAAFMRRLGDALTPAVLTNTEAVPAYNLDQTDADQSAHLCRVGPIAASDYPRRAIIYGQFAGLAGGTLQLFGTTSASTNGGAFTRTAPQGIGMRAHAAGAVWASVAQTASLDLAPGSTYAFAFFVQRAAEDNGSADLQSGRCNMTVTIFSRTGTAAPFDAAAAEPFDNVQ